MKEANRNDRVVKFQPLQNSFCLYLSNVTFMSYSNFKNQLGTHLAYFVNDRITGKWQKRSRRGRLSTLEH